MTTALIVKGLLLAFGAFGGGAGVLKLLLKYWPGALKSVIRLLLKNPIARMFLTGHEEDVMAMAHLAVDILQQSIDAAQAEDATPPAA